MGSMEEFCDSNGMVVVSRETRRDQKAVGLVSVVLWVVAVLHCHLAAFKVFGPSSVIYFLYCMYFQCQLLSFVCLYVLVAFFKLM